MKTRRDIWDAFWSPELFGRIWTAEGEAGHPVPRLASAGTEAEMTALVINPVGARIRSKGAPKGPADGVTPEWLLHLQRLFGLAFVVDLRGRTPVGLCAVLRLCWRVADEGALKRPQAPRTSSWANRLCRDDQRWRKRVDITTGCSRQTGQEPLLASSDRDEQH